MHVEELKRLFLVHFVLVNVVVALMSHDAPDHLDCRDGVLLDHVQQCFMGELTNDARLTANDVRRPRLPSLQKLLNAQHRAFLVHEVVHAGLPEGNELP